MTTTADLARVLQAERKRQNLTVSDIIDRAAVSRAAVYRLFNGGDVQLTTLLAVTSVLGLDLVPMRARLAQLVPDAIVAAPAQRGFRSASMPPASQAPARNIDVATQGAKAPWQGPLSSASARAAALQSRLKPRKP